MSLSACGASKVSKFYRHTKRARKRPSRYDLVRARPASRMKGDDSGRAERGRRRPTWGIHEKVFFFARGDCVPVYIRVMMPIIIAVGLGPALAGLVVLTPSLAGLLENPSSQALSDLVGFFVFTMVFSYVIGSPIAAIAGALVSIWMVWRRPTLLVTMAAAVIATSGFMSIAALGALGPVQETNGRSNFLFTLVLAVIASIGCWFVARPFDRSQARRHPR